MNQRHILTLVAALSFLSHAASAALAAEFYDPSCETRSTVKDLQKDSGASGAGDVNDSNKLQQAIDAVSQAGGGVVSIPAGVYSISEIELKSNVHVEIAKAVVIKPWIGGTDKSVGIFNLGSEQLAIENVSVKGIGGKYTVQMPKHRAGIRVFSMSNVRNFLIDNCHVEDQLTKFSALQFGPSGLRRGQRAIPTSGTARNISVINAAYGYGVVQTQAAHSILFENLAGVGGVTLRLETGYSLMNDVQFGGLKNIVGRNISCEDGNAAAMLSPHAMTNGVVTIDGVVSKGCGFGVRIDRGFVSKKYTAQGLQPGSFAAGSSVKNVTATFGTKAQLKPKHFKFMPEQLQKDIQSMDDSEDGQSVRGPSIAAMLNESEYEVQVDNVNGIGFKFASAILTDADTKPMPFDWGTKPGSGKRGKTKGSKATAPSSPR